MFSDSRSAGRSCLALVDHVRQSNVGLRHLDGQALLAFVPNTVPSPIVCLVTRSGWGFPSWRDNFASLLRRRASLAANKLSAMHK
jgi:hypothetical protein